MLYSRNLHNTVNQLYFNEGLPRWHQCLRTCLQHRRHRDLGLISGSGRSPGGLRGNPLQYSCLENPMNKGAWQATVCGAANSQTQLKRLSTHIHILQLKEQKRGNSLVVQWLRLCAPSAGGPGLIPGQGTAAAAAKSLQSCPTVRPHRWQPTRLPRPWDSPGKNTGVGCHFLLQCMKVKSESEVAQSCPALCDPIDSSPPGSSVHGIFQARVLEWGAIAFCSQGTRSC